VGAGWGKGYFLPFGPAPSHLVVELVKNGCRCNLIVSVNSGVVVRALAHLFFLI
jgi:hypothetical protein